MHIQTSTANSLRTRNLFKKNRAHWVVYTLVLLIKLIIN